MVCSLKVVGINETIREKTNGGDQFFGFSQSQLGYFCDGPRVDPYRTGHFVVVSSDNFLYFGTHQICWMRLFIDFHNTQATKKQYGASETWCQNKGDFVE